MGIFEIMLLDDDMRDMIIKHASTQVLRAEARKRGMRTLRDSGLLAIYDGMTTIEEVVRETIMEEIRGLWDGCGPHSPPRQVPPGRPSGLKDQTPVDQLENDRR
jgi:hypothetical protein